MAPRPSPVSSGDGCCWMDYIRFANMLFDLSMQDQGNENKKKTGEKTYRMEKKLKLPLIGSIPEDNIIMEFDLEGKPLIDIPKDSESFMSLKNVIEQFLSSIMI